MEITSGVSSFSYSKYQSLFYVFFNLPYFQGIGI